MSYDTYRLSRISFRTVCADTTLLAASGMTIDCGLSMTSSETIMFLLTGVPPDREAVHEIRVVGQGHFPAVHGP